MDWQVGDPNENYGGDENLLGWFVVSRIVFIDYDKED